MILDTNAVSAFAEDDAELIAKLPIDRPWLLPVIVIGEFHYGILGSRWESKLRDWFAQVTDVVAVLEITEETAHFYAAVRNQLKNDQLRIPPNDSWIAALALQHDQPVLSRDSDFDKVKGITRIPW